MKPNAIELDGAEIAVEIAPGRSGGIIQAVETAIAAIQIPASRIEVGSVMVGVGRSKIRRAAVANTRPVRTAVDRA